MELFHNLTTLLSLIELSPIDQQFASVLQNICMATVTEQDTRTVIYMQTERTSYDHPNVPLILHTLRTQTPTAVVNIDISVPVESYKDRFNLNLLSIVQLSQNATSDVQLLQSLWERLQGNRQARLILLFDDSASEGYVAKVLQLCAIHHAVNVIALQPQMAVKEHSYHALQIFPAQKTVRQTLPPSYLGIFSEHLENMHGHRFRILDFKYNPQIYNYTPEHGPAALSGFIGRALAEYARRRNGTIQFIQSAQHDTLGISEIREALDTEILDAVPLFPISYILANLTLSNAIRFDTYCLMVPLEKPIPKFTFYYAIADISVVILFCSSLILISCILAVITRWHSRQRAPLTDYLVNISVLQALLGMPIWINNRTPAVHKLFYVLFSGAGVIIAAAYGTYLQTYSVDAPIEPYTQTIGGLLQRGIKIGMYAGTLTEDLYPPEFSKYIQNFTLINNNSDFFSLQDKLDTRYATLVSEMWAVYDEQQKYFSRPLFRLSDMCLWRNLPMALPLPANSVYREDLNKLFSKLIDSGLIDHWVRHSFVELLEMHVIKAENLNMKAGFVPLKVDDLHVVFIVLSAFLTLSTCCFVMEIVWVKVRKPLNANTKTKQKMVTIRK